VVDMLYFPLFKINDFEFFSAIFNISDASISTGVISLLLFQKRFFKKHRKDPQPAIETSTDVSDKVQVL
ncbi:MAG: signal peptidase II, partial [Bacteroidota bacterium]